MDFNHLAPSKQVTALGSPGMRTVSEFSSGGLHAPQLGFCLGVPLALPPNVTLPGFCQGLRFAHPLPMKHSLFAPLPAFQQEGAFFFGTVFPVRFPKVGGGSSTQKNIDQGGKPGRHGTASSCCRRISGDRRAVTCPLGA